MHRQNVPAFALVLVAACTEPSAPVASSVPDPSGSSFESPRQPSVSVPDESGSFSAPGDSTSAESPARTSEATVPVTSRADSDRHQRAGPDGAGGERASADDTDTRSGETDRESEDEVSLGIPGAATHLAAALSPDAPEAFVLVTSRAYLSDEVVLYRLRGAELWRAQAARRGTLASSEARDQRAFDACEEGDDTFDALENCIMGTSANRYVAWDQLYRDGVWIWALARVHRASGRIEVRASRRLFEEAALDLGEGETELRIGDLDDDGEPEITVMFRLMVPDTDMYTEVAGSMGYILAWDDLHTQFRTSRTFEESSGDADTRSSRVRTVWLVREQNADGHRDLQVTERAVEEWSDPESDDEGERATTTRGTCLWRAEDDIFHCDRTLGDGLFEHGAQP